MDEEARIIEAAVQEYLFVSRDYGWPDRERLAAYFVIRNIMRNARLYDGFCDRLAECSFEQRAGDL